MKRLLITLSAALALLAVAGPLDGPAAQAAPATASACKDGPTTVRGAGALRYCGPASAVVKVGGARCATGEAAACAPPPRWS
jgi:hypothetical protein